MNKLIVLTLLFLATPLYGQDIYYRNVGEIQSIFQTDGVSVSGVKIQVPIVNGLVPDMVEGNREDGSKYYIFDYRNKRSYNDFKGFVVNYDPNFKVKKIEVVTTIQELKLRRPSEVGGQINNLLLPNYPKE